MEQISSKPLPSIPSLQLLSCKGGMVIDTTAWNTGVIKGAASKLKQILKRPVLWIGCRHHTCELHIKHAYIACCGDVFTKGKDNQLFKRLHTEWDAHFGDWIRSSDGQPWYTCWVWPDDVNAWKYRRAEFSWPSAYCPLSPLQTNS